jgi:transglutaminase-like putative cysteine protease
MVAKLRRQASASKKTGKTTAKRQTEYLVRDKLAWLLVMQALIILPLLMNLPVWLLLVWATAALWRIQMFRGRWGAPGGAIKTLLTVVCAAGLLASYSGRAGTDTMVGLLVCAFSLKLLEVNSARDAQLLVFIGFIITATQFLFSQTPQAAAYGIVCVVLLLTSWRSLYLTHQQTAGVRLKRGAMILLHALPIMLVLFIVVPRLGPLWAIPNQQMAKTGFSDSLSPGDLGNLALNRAPAFRVEFTGQPPSANQLYWRGLVLDVFDGRTWRMRDSWGFRPADLTTPGGTRQDRLDYSIIMEPHGQPWLFSLMTPQTVENPANSIRITGDSLLMNRIPVAQRMRYQVSSALRIDWEVAPQLINTQYDFYTRLPRDSNPQTHALAADWRSQNLTDEQIIARALTLFNQEFTYTLQPPLLGAHSVDEFLLVSKRGFCEHFASSFSVLLRAAGIPARVVVGYQGGRWNPVENYLLVSQSDAHAWTEVWIEGKGWQMIDPTAAVAPNRIEQGMNEALNETDQELVGSAWQSSRLLYNLQLRWDAATYTWQRWVLNYDSEAQEGLLSRLLGGTESWRLTLWLIGLGAAGAALFAWALLRHHKKPAVRAETEVINLLEQKLGQLGYRRKPGETLGDFIRRILISEPQLHAGLVKIAHLFEQIAYQNQQDKLAELQQRVKQFPR